MKMVKSLLLGSAAGLVAVVGAQAADLPVKAKAVEYVKVCSLYGAGFYYIPGTDTCIKIGGYVRAEYYHNSLGSFPTTGAGGYFSRSSNTYGTRSRGMLSADVRTQTEYGTLRSYMRYGQNWTTGAGTTAAGLGNTFQFERAFIQFAGFTFGRTDSYFDFYNGAAYGLTPTGLESTVGPAGINVAAYTAQFGNGVSASISLEEQSQRQGGVFLINAAYTAAAQLGAAATGGQQTPDIVGNIRVDQAWGSAQVMGALHQVNPTYYSVPAGNIAHPGNEWGWAVGAGLTLKMPWNAADTFSMQAGYSEGAIKYAANGIASAQLTKSGGIAVGGYSDAVFVNGGSLELTKAWSITGAFEHYWTPNLRTSVIGAFADISYNSTATAALAAQNPTFVGSPDWQIWRVGSRTMWNPVANLDIGLEVFYNKVKTAYAGSTVAAASFNNQAVLKDQDVWTGAVRVQRNFWP